jgi:hypothetical protein
MVSMATTILAKKKHENARPRMKRKWKSATILKNKHILLRNLDKDYFSILSLISNNILVVILA